MFSGMSHVGWRSFPPTSALSLRSRSEPRRGGGGSSGVLSRTLEFPKGGLSLCFVLDSDMSLRL